MTAITVFPHIVQTATALPAADAGWTTRPQLICETCGEGAVNDAGAATIRQYAGYGHLPGSTTPGMQSILAGLLGQYVRVLLEDGGPITIGGKSYTQLFQGQIARQRTVPDGSIVQPGAVVEFSCLGLASLLDQLYVHRGYETSFGVGVPVNPGQCPAFNAKLGVSTTGDRSSITWSVNGQMVYISDLSPLASGTAWTALELAKLLLAGFASASLPVVGIVGPNWVLGGDTTALAYTFDKRELHGRTLFECLNLLINPRRGLTWQAVPAAVAPYTSITIFIDSASSVAVTAGSFTLPAAAEQNALDLRGVAYAQGFEIEEDAASCYDVIQVEGNCPLVAISAAIHCTTATILTPPTNGDFHTETIKRGWVASFEYSWDPSIDQGVGYQHVYTRYVFQDSYNGHQYLLDATDGMRNFRPTTDAGSSAPSKAKYGVGGYTGLRSYLDGGGSPAPAPSAGGLRLEPFVPIDVEAGADVTKGLCSPLIFIKEGAVYEDLTLQYGVTIENEPPAVVLNASPDRIAELADRLNQAGVELVFTLGVRERMPLTVSYQADISTWPRDLPRVLVRRVPWAEQWIGLKGSAVGVSGGGLLTLPANQTVIDDLPRLQDYLAILRVWYGSPAVNVTWTVKGVVDASRAAGFHRPGSLVTTVHRGDAAITCNGVVMSRVWNLTEADYGTTYTTRRLIPDLEAVESGMAPVKKHSGAVEAGRFAPVDFDPDREFSGKPLGHPVFVDRGER